MEDRPVSEEERDHAQLSEAQPPVRGGRGPEHSGRVRQARPCIAGSDRRHSGLDWRARQRSTNIPVNWNSFWISPPASRRCSNTAVSTRPRSVDSKGGSVYTVFAQCTNGKTKADNKNRSKFICPELSTDCGCASHASGRRRSHTDRKSTRLNSSHLVISYAVFCLKKYN